MRYADDVVVGFEHESDARRFWDAMRERLRKFSLSLHPDKTRLIAARARKTGDLQLSGLHLHYRQVASREIPPQASLAPGPHEGKA